MSINENNHTVDGGQDIPVPAHLNFGKFMFDKIRHLGDKVALHNVSTGVKYTYKELTQQAVDLSVGFTKLGMKKGDFVSLSVNTIEFVPMALAVIFTGATLIPHNTNIGRAILKHRIKVVPPTFMIIGSEQFWNEYSDILEEIHFKAIITTGNVPSSAVTINSLLDRHCDIYKFAPAKVFGQTDTAVIYFSSGTSGLPKAVELTHLNCILHSLADDYNFFNKTRLNNGLWATNYYDFKAFMFLGSGKEIICSDTIFSVESLLCDIEKYKVDIVFCIPRMVNELTNVNGLEKYDLSSLKVIHSRSAPLQTKMIEKFKNIFPPTVELVQAYGMTECGELASEVRVLYGSIGVKHGSVGIPSRGITLKVVNPETGESLPPNTHGEICVKGAALMKGYIGVDPSTYLDKQGFFKTGDLGYYDDDGYFYVIDRLKDVMIVNSNNLTPILVETVLQLHPGVQEAGVVGMPHPTIGDAPVAFVVRQPESNVTAQELIDYFQTEHNVSTGVKYTYKELTQQAVDLSVGFTKLGMKKGDFVSLSVNTIEFVPMALAVIFTGATLIPHNTNIGRAILKHRIKVVPPTFMIIGSEQFWNEYSDILEEIHFKAIITTGNVPSSAVTINSLLDRHCDIDKFAPAKIFGQTDAAVIYFSSGTSGLPKAVELTHLNCILHSLADDYNFFNKTRLNNGLWATNYYDFKAFMFLGSGKEIICSDTIFSVESLLCDIEKYKVDIVFCIPRMVNELTNVNGLEKYDLSSLKVIHSRSAPLQTKMIEKFKNIFPPTVELVQAYGMTECGELASEVRVLYGSIGVKHGSVGIPSRGITLKVVNPETGESLPPNTHGEICVKGAALMKGYIGVDPSTYLDKQGFFKTGDLGYYDDDGYFYVIDRLKDVMIVNSNNLTPILVETVLQLHPGVQEAGVVGMPHPTIGDAPVAFVVRQPESNVTAQELIDYFQTEMGKFPLYAVHFVSELPRNDRGKILRRQLREMLKQART